MSEYCSDEPFFVALTSRILACAAADEPSPEDLAAESEEREWRMVRPAEDGPDRARVAALTAVINDALPLEEAYLLHQVLLGVSQREIARVCGMAQPSVHYRIRQALAKLRAHIEGGTAKHAVPMARFRVPGRTAYAAK